MDEDEQFAELMKKSSLGAPAARSITARVDPAHAENIRRIVRLRNELADGTTLDKLDTARELVELVQSLGFAWRDEVPDAFVYAALKHVTQLRRMNDLLVEHCRKLEMEVARLHTEKAAASTPHASQPLSTQNTTQPGDHPLKGARFLTVQEAAEALRVSKMTVYRMVHDEELPSIRVGRSFRVPEHAVHEYLREAVADRLARNTND